jgi:Ser-tRNA(Ala) deacylase AlaX
MEAKMSELIFQQDSYIKEFDCRVTEVIEEENAITLDRTAFYPEGGGQLSDKGVLETATAVYKVSKVKKKGTITTLTAPFLLQMRCAKENWIGNTGIR